MWLNYKTQQTEKSLKWAEFTWKGLNEISALSKTGLGVKQN